MSDVDNGVLKLAKPWTFPARLIQLGQNFGAMLALVLLIFYNILFTPRFLTMATLNINLTQVATIVIVATGMTMVIAMGGIDLSVGSLMAIAGALAPLIFLKPIMGNHVLGIALAFIVPVAVAGMFGLFNGVLVARFRIQPIIATLVLFIAGRGIAQMLTNGNLQPFKDDAFQFIGLGKIFGIPFQVILMIIIVGGVALTMRVSSFGRFILAIGGNEAAARLAGIPIFRVKLIVYGLCGLFAGIAGLIVISLNSSSDANQVGLNMELDAIAAVAVGGTPLTGGRITIWGTFLGAIIMQLIRFTLLSHLVPDALALVIKAVIIIMAVYIQRRKE